MRHRRVIVIGAGMAGLAAAIDLAGRGLQVTVLERAAAPGGKMRQLNVAGAAIDAGPTVFTMRWVFDELFADAGASFVNHVTLRPADVLARHAWAAEHRLDLFADIDRSADAIGQFAGSVEARGYRAFCARAQQVFTTLDRPFMRAPRPTAVSLTRALGLRGLPDLWRIRPFATLWQELGRYFRDPRLRQLFARYATYSGASPFLAPATLMLIAHVERVGVWLVDGGMHRIARAMAALAEQRGAQLRYGSEAAEIVMAAGQITAVRLASGERLAADTVILAADSAALQAGLFGHAATQALPAAPQPRSLSALTWNLHASSEGFPLHRHNVLFCRDYAAEFDDIFRRNRLPTEPTVYICAQDRDDTQTHITTPERLFCLVNAPPTGDRQAFTEAEIAQCEERTFSLLERCGLRIHRQPQTTQVTTPADFNRLFPATGGALYGPALHGSTSAFRRPGSRSKIPGLYLAGGSAHPGPGIPMATISGRLAAASLIADLASTSRSPPTATPGGTSTP